MSITVHNPGIGSHAKGSTRRRHRRLRWIVPVGVVAVAGVSLGVAARDAGTAGESADAAITLQPSYQMVQEAIDDALAANGAVIAQQSSYQMVQNAIDDALAADTAPVEQSSTQMVQDSIDDALAAAGR